MEKVSSPEQAPGAGASPVGAAALGHTGQGAALTAPLAAVLLHPMVCAL